MGENKQSDLASGVEISFILAEKPDFYDCTPTFRHDLKIYSSDEGRVVTTAAAFAKGFLNLEGPLPPIITSLVRSDEHVTALLDDSSAASLI